MFIVFLLFVVLFSVVLLLLFFFFWWHIYLVGEDRLVSLVSCFIAPKQFFLVPPSSGTRKVVHFVSCYLLSSFSPVLTAESSARESIRSGCFVSHSRRNRLLTDFIIAITHPAPLGNLVSASHLD